MFSLPMIDNDRTMPRTAWSPRDLPISRRILIWGAVQFCLSFAEQVGELLAPMLFVAGCGWWAVLRVIGSMTLDEHLMAVAQRVPTRLLIGGHLVAPGRLIEDGLLLMALVAACRTINGIIAKET
jgi:hypothetical protein